MTEAFHNEDIRNHIPKICLQCAACYLTVMDYEHIENKVAVTLEYNTLVGSGSVTVLGNASGGGSIVRGRCPTGRLH